MAEAPRDRDHLLVQLHHDPGGRRTTETLVPAPATPADAGRVAFGYLGDLQLRFVFELPGESPPSAARADDLARLALTPTKAVAIATLNARKLCGAPVANVLEGGVSAVRGPHPEHILGYLLDRGFWRRLLADHPAGLVVALPRRGLLLFAPLKDVAARNALVKQAAGHVKTAGAARVSEFVFRFDATGWHAVGTLPGTAVVAAATAPPPPPTPAPRRARYDDDDDDDGAIVIEAQDFDEAARGQRMLVWGAGAGLLAQAWLLFGAHSLFLILLAMAASAYAAMGVIRLCEGLTRPFKQTIAWLAASFVPVVALGAWIWLHRQASRELRDAGREVTWLGGRLDGSSP